MTSGIQTTQHEERGRERRRPREKAATQERILQAAMALFVERGYERTTIADLAAQAGVSRATVFWHFGDKAGLFHEAFSRLLVPFREEVEASPTCLDAEKRLRDLATVYASFVEQQRTVIEGFVRWAVESPEFRPSLMQRLMSLHERFRAEFAQNLAQVLPPDRDPDALASGLIAMLDGNLLLSLFDPGVEPGRRRRLGVEAVLELIPRKKDRG
jgi:AcrR family transcriptional regulator